VPRGLRALQMQSIVCWSLLTKTSTYFGVYKTVNY